MKKSILALAGACLLTTTVSAGSMLTNVSQRDKTPAVTGPVKAFKPTAIGDGNYSAPMKAQNVQKVISPETPFGSFYNYEVGDDQVNFWAFQCFGVGSWTRGVLHATTPYTTYSDHICAWEAKNDSGEEIITAGCMVGDKYWAYVAQSFAGGMVNVPVGIYEINLETGEKASKPLFDDYISQEDAEGRANEVLLEMSYDPVSDYVYALRKQVVGEWPFYETAMTLDVVRLDPANPSAGFEKIGEVDYSFTMACDDGYIYFIQSEFEDTGDIDDNGVPVFRNLGCTLYRLNLEENANVEQSGLEKVAKINRGFLQINYLQTMEFDHSDHTLWWSGSKDDAYGTGFVTTLDTEKAETGDLYEMQSLVQYVAMAIPYELKVQGTPHYVRNLAYTVGTQGEGKVDFTWTNPSKDSNKKALTDLTEIKIYKDGSLYKTVAATGIGQIQSWSDTGVASGTHSYKFVATNGKGDGLSRQRNIFIGRDVPGAVTNINVTTAGAKATITWTPSIAGANNGWYDKSTLKYTVTRMPDNKIVADKISETTVNDEATEFKGYTYKIVASNADGTGLEATSFNAAFGPDVEIPYLNEMKTQQDADVMTVIDNNNDGVKWTFGVGHNGGNAYIYDYCANKPDDWLITPPFKMDPAKKYKIYFTYATSNYKDTKEKIEIRQGKSNTAAAQTELLSTIIGLPTSFGYDLQGEAVINDVSKGNYISIHVDSDADQGWILFKDFLVREYSATDVSAKAIDGPIIAYTGSPNIFTVTIKNEGSAAVRGAKAQLIDKNTGEVLAEAAAPAMKPGEEKSVDVAWQPAKQGEITVSARAYLDGDTYLGDNDLDDSLYVSVVGGTASEWFSPIKKDGSGWVPFYVGRGYSAVETIYMVSEINREKINITGIAYPYEKADDLTGLSEIPVEIYIAETDLTSLATLSGGEYVAIPLPSSMYTKVFEGIVDMSGDKQRNEIDMMFSTPYNYKGDKNLVIKAVANINDATEGNPYWYIKSEFGKPEEEMRSVYDDRNKVRLNDQVAAIKIAYKTEEGVEGVITIGLQISGAQNSIKFSENVDYADIFDAQGRKVTSVKNVNTVSNLDKGCYIVCAKKGSTVVSSKVFVR